ncbi:MAG TPA: CHRD domain-containing protein [Nitrososphaeraceae archaeon]
MSDLVTAMSNESTYVNVHTEQYPNGKIRGQIMSGSYSRKIFIHT